MNNFTLRLRGRELVLNCGAVTTALGTHRLSDVLALALGLVPVPGSRGRWIRA